MNIRKCLNDLKLDDIIEIFAIPLKLDYNLNKEQLIENIIEKLKKKRSFDLIPELNYRDPFDRMIIQNKIIPNIESLTISVLKEYAKKLHYNQQIDRKDALIFAVTTRADSFRNEYFDSIFHSLKLLGYPITKDGLLKMSIIDLKYVCEFLFIEYDNKSNAIDNILRIWQEQRNRPKYYEEALSYVNKLMTLSEDEKRFNTYINKLSEEDLRNVLYSYGRFSDVPKTKQKLVQKIRDIFYN